MNENALNVMSMLSLTRPSQPESHSELVHRFGYSVLPIDQYTGVSGVTFWVVLTCFSITCFSIQRMSTLCGPNWKYQFRKEAVDMWPKYLYLNSVGLQLIENEKYPIQLLEARSSTACNRNVDQWKISWEPYFAQISVFVNLCNGCRNPGSRSLL